MKYPTKIPFVFIYSFLIFFHGGLYLRSFSWKFVLQSSTT
jgi:predicted DNA-binding transcriptional regulator